MRARYAIPVAALAACTPKTHAMDDAAAPDTGVDAAVAIDAAPSIGQMMVPTFPSYDKICPPTSDGGTAPSPVSSAAPRAAVVDVAFDRTVRTKKGEGTTFVGRVTAPALRFQRDVFLAGVEDPHHCCAKVEAGALTFDCGFSGIDLFEGHGRAWREGDVLVVEWCTADLSTGQANEKGREEVPLPPGATVRFRAPVPACAPPLPK